MENIMHLDFISGINSDGFRITIMNNNQMIFEKRYSFEYNASSSRKNAEYAKKDYEDSIKYNWVRSSYHSLKPFINDIINEIKERFEIKDHQIFYSGYNVFNKQIYTYEKAKEMFDSFNTMF